MKKTKTLGVISAVALVTLSNISIASAILDPIYTDEQARIAAEQADDAARAEAALKLGNPKGEESTNTVTNTITKIIVTPAPTPSPAAEPAVLGVSTQRDHLDEYYNDLKADLSVLKASAEKNEQQLKQSQTERYYQNIAYGILGLILAFLAIFAEVKYAKLSSQLGLIKKHFKKK